MRRGPVIAEVKTKSPFGFESPLSWDVLFDLAVQKGDWIAIHVEAAWGGSLALLAEARKRTDKILVAKGLHADNYKIGAALRAGADLVLVVGRLPTYEPDRCLLEPEDLAQLATFPRGVRAVWNARDLRTGERKRESWEEARKLFPGWLCQASFIRSAADVAPDADACLVGEHLPEFTFPLRLEKGLDK